MISITRKDVTHIVSNETDSISRSVAVEGRKLWLPLQDPQYFNTDRSKAVPFCDSLLLLFLAVRIYTLVHLLCE